DGDQVVVSALFNVAIQLGSPIGVVDGHRAAFTFGDIGDAGFCRQWFWRGTRTLLSPLAVYQMLLRTTKWGQAQSD
ncbi:hypothetical protein BG011_006004, partial [Mortierella polycephala]